MPYDTKSSHGTHYTYTTGSKSQELFINGKKSQNLANEHGTKKNT